MNNLTIIPILVLTFGVIMGAFLLYDRIITNKRLKISQKDWDEFSKGMTRAQKEDIFCEWLECHQLEKGWPHLYIPSIHHAERRCDH